MKIERVALCNCDHDFSQNYTNSENALKPTIIDGNDTCIYCGYYAVFEFLKGNEIIACEN